MLRSVVWYAHFIGSLLVMQGEMRRYKKARLTMPPDEFAEEIEKVTNKWAMSQVKYSGARVTVNGIENIPKDGAVLFVANHQSNFDIALFISFIRKPKGYISKTETLKLPMVRDWMRYLDCVFIDRKDIKKSAQAITDGIKILKEGHSLVVFPEGTRSKGGPVGEFKAGSFKLATKSQVPIIPVTINGTYKIMEANKWRIKPADVTLTVHPKIETAGLSKEETAALPETVKEIIVTGL